MFDRVMMCRGGDIWNDWTKPSWFVSALYHLWDEFLRKCWSNWTIYLFWNGVIQPPEMIENWNAFGLNLSQMLEPIGKRQFFGDFSFSILMGSNWLDDPCPGFSPLCQPMPRKSDLERLDEKWRTRCFGSECGCFQKIGGFPPYV